MTEVKILAVFGNPVIFCKLMPRNNYALQHGYSHAPKSTNTQYPRGNMTSWKRPPLPSTPPYGVEYQVHEPVPARRPLATIYIHVISALEWESVTWRTCRVSTKGTMCKIRNFENFH